MTGKTSVTVTQVAVTVPKLDTTTVQVRSCPGMEVSGKTILTEDTSVKNIPMCWLINSSISVTRVETSGNR